MTARRRRPALPAGVACRAGLALVSPGPASDFDARFVRARPAGSAFSSCCRFACACLAAATRADRRI